MIFFKELIKSEKENIDKDEIKKHIAENLMPIFIRVPEGYIMCDYLKHPPQLYNFSDMLKKEYLCLKEYDKE